MASGTLLLMAMAACSATDPVPSPRYDGRYAGTRQSDLTAACGVTQLQGTTTARVTDGRLALPLFSSKTQMTGDVGDDGRVRASGIWRNPTGGFPRMTVLNGQITGNTLDGTATDFRCHTELHLRMAEPSHARSGKRVRTKGP